MSDDDRLARLRDIRREPPPLLPVELVERVEVNERLLRLTFEGDGARAVTVAEPASSVRLLVPDPGTDELVIPEWSGNEFLLADGSRPVLRTFTPLRFEDGRLDLEIIRHPGGAVSGWAEAATPGSPAAISGPGSGYEFPDRARRLLVFGDETALPAITQLVDMAPAGLALEIHVEVVVDGAEPDVPLRHVDAISWYLTAGGQVPGQRIVEAARSLGGLPEGTDVWAAGEASAMHAIRTHLFDTLGVDRSRATVRGYWKPARP